jgi:hypothetical protein
LLAVLDETYPELTGGIAYTVGAAVILADERTARSALAGIFTDTHRTRPFHWQQEGPAARSAMIAVLTEIGAVAHICVHYPTGRRKLQAARAKALRQIVPRIMHDGASRLLIESRGEVEDRRDRAVILDVLNARTASGTLQYEWRTKSEPLIWLADGICGATRQHLLQLDDSPFNELQQAGVIGELIYISS